jgi:phosphoribosylanthranilate isomerase
MGHEAGASMLGVILSDLSPRKGNPDLIRKLKEMEIKVAAVYTDMEHALKNNNEDYAQLHFYNNSEQIDKIKESGRKVISVINVNNCDNVKLAELIKGRVNADLILLESKEGISEKINIKTVTMNKKIGLAGKIGKENIRGLLDLNPGFIDLSSSLESYPGKKDPMKIKEFFMEVSNVH